MKNKYLSLVMIGLLVINSSMAKDPVKADEVSEQKKYDLNLKLSDETINNIFSSIDYPKFLYKIPGRINIDPLRTKSEEIKKESELEMTSDLLMDAINTQELAKKILDDIQRFENKGISQDEIAELRKLTETDIEEYLKKGFLKLRSMEIFRFEIYLNSSPRLTFDNNTIELRDLELKVIYNIRIHYKIGFIKSHIDFNTSGQKIQSTISLNSYKRDSKVLIKPEINRLKFVFRIAGFKVTLNMLDYFKPDLKEVELVDVEKLVLSIPSINTNVVVKEFDLIIDDHNLGLGISLGFN